MVRKAFILGLSLCCSCLYAQDKKDIITSLKADKPGQGKVRIFQDPKIEALLKSVTAEVVSTGDKNIIKATGYRIQVFAGNNTREARNRAISIGEQVAKLFPELAIYTPFVSPRWICRVGDFRSIEEADAMLRKLRATNKFKEVSIVREQIVIPLD